MHFGHAGQAPKRLHLTDDNNEIRNDILDRTQRAVRRGRRAGIHRNMQLEDALGNDELHLDLEPIHAGNSSSHVPEILPARPPPVAERALTPLISGSITTRPWTELADGSKVRTDSKAGIVKNA